MDELKKPLYVMVSFEWSSHPGLASALAESPYLPTALIDWTRFSESPFQIGEIPPGVAQYLQASTCTVMLTSDTFQKQQNHHPEISPEFYALVPVIFREGEAFEQDSPAKAQFIWQAGCTAPDCLDQRLASRCLPGNPGLAGLVGCAPA